MKGTSLDINGPTLVVTFVTTLLVFYLAIELQVYSVLALVCAMEGTSLDKNRPTLAATFVTTLLVFYLATRVVGVKKIPCSIHTTGAHLIKIKTVLNGR